MQERDKFAFAALSNLMQSDGDAEVIHDTAMERDQDVNEIYADLAYKLGDAMLKRSAEGPYPVTFAEGKRQVV